MHWTNALSDWLGMVALVIIGVGIAIGAILTLLIYLILKACGAV